MSINFLQKRNENIILDASTCIFERCIRCSLSSDSKFLRLIVFTKDFLDAYSELKYKEYTAFAQTPTAWEVSMYADA